MKSPACSFLDTGRVNGASREMLAGLNSWLNFGNSTLDALASHSFLSKRFLFICKRISDYSGEHFILKFAPIFAAPHIRATLIISSNYIAGNGADTIFNRHFRFLLRPQAHGLWTLGIIAPLLLSACSSQLAIGPPVFIHDRQYLPIPATLTAPVAVDLSQGITWGKAVGVLAQGLQTCNGRLTAIEMLKPPPGAL